MAVREATVGPLSGTSDVSTGAISTSPGSMPRASAAIIGKIVFVPWPISVLATSTRTTPSSPSSTPATLARWTSPLPVKPAPCQARARPMPEARPSGRAQAASRLDRLAQRTPRVCDAELADALVLGGLGGARQDLGRADALAQDLAGRRHAALAVQPALAQLRR